MKVLLYWHDVYLPYSDYLIRAFANHPEITQLCVVGPKEYQADTIYQADPNKKSYPAHVVCEQIKTYSFRRRWGCLSEFRKCVRKFQPDCIIVLDEGFSINAFNLGFANFLEKNSASVLFYGFENIAQTPPWKYLMDDFSVERVKVFCRKTLRYFFVDLLLQPIRLRVLSGGLVCYEEGATVLHQFGWQPQIRFQWWGLNLEPFLAQSALQRSENSLQANARAIKILGYVGRFVEEKGVFDLLDLLIALGPDYHLRLIGNGPLEEELRSKVNILGLKERVEFIAAQPQAVLAKLYSAIDVLVLPSHTSYFWKEQYGRVLIEAMACGTPVVGSRSGAIPEVIGDPMHCFAEGNIQEMKSVIERVIGMSITLEYRQNLTQRALRANAVEFVSAYLRLYQDLLRS